MPMFGNPSNICLFSSAKTEFVNYGKNRFFHSQSISFLTEIFMRIVPPTLHENPPMKAQKIEQVRSYYN